MSYTSTPQKVTSSESFGFLTYDRSSAQDGSVRIGSVTLDLASGDTKTASQLVRGQQSTANSVPVCLPSDQMGTAGTPAAAVMSIQGITNGTAITVTANAGTNLNTSLLALESGGNLATIVTNTTGLNSTVGTAGSAIPSKGIIVQGSDGTLARAISVTAAGIQKVDISGTAANATAIKVDGSAVTQPVSAASLPLPTGAATAANQTSVIGTIGAGTAAANSLAVGGVYNTSLPTLTTGQQAAVQLDSSGRQLVNVTTLPSIPAGANTIGAVTQASGPWTNNVTQIGGASLALGQTTMASSIPVTVASNQGAFPVKLQDGSGNSLASTSSALNVALLADSTPATQNITAADIASSTAAGANSQSIITGAPTANSAASFAVTGVDTVNLQASGTWVGTLQTEVSMDGGTTWSIRGLHQFGTAYTATSYTANFVGGMNTAGITNVRVRCTAYTSGTATITLTKSILPATMYLANAATLADATTRSQQLSISSAGAAKITTDQTTHGTTDLVAADLTKISGTATATGNGTASAGCQRVTIASDNTTFSVNSVQSGTWTVQPGNTQNTTAWLVAEQAATAGGYSCYSFLSTAAVQAANIKNAAGQVYALHFTNTSATIAYVRLYNQTTSPANTDTPVYRAAIPANTGGTGLVVHLPAGFAFSTGIGIRVTAAAADNDTTSLAANVVCGNVLYK